MGWEEEYRAFEDSCALVDLPWSIFEINGPDSRKFLNGLVTNDVAKLESAKAMAACLLTPKGMLRAHFLLYDSGQAILALCPAESASNFAETMKKMIVLSESKFEDAGSRLGCLLAAGPSTEKVLGLSAGLAAALVPWPRLSPDCKLIVYEKSRREGLLDSLHAAGAAAAGPEAFNVWRVERGLPIYGIDMGEDTIPLEARLEDAISFDKGCYMGQETISRVHNLGHLNKVLVQLKVTAAELPAAGSAVLAEGKEVGKVTSAAVSPNFGGILALATVRLEHSKPGTVLGVASGRGSHRAQVVSSPGT
ncbi:MAG: folate-binding protein YgfZ [Elusimicrobia bacterium]|nr:folate-binding protein YgfZ [Elusimicrobiota bacterium]